MQKLVECPACEEQFEVASQTKSVQCPECNREFDAKSVSDSRKRHESGDSSTSGRFSESVFESLNPHVRTTQPSDTNTQSSRSSAAPPETTTEVNSDNNSEINSPFTLTNPAKKSASIGGVPEIGDSLTPGSRITKRSSATLWMIGLMGLIGLIAVFGVLYVALDQTARAAERDSGKQDEPVETNPQPETAGSDSIVQNSEADTEIKRAGDAASDSDDSQTRRVESNSNDRPLTPGEDEMPAVLSLDQFKSVWNRNYSYVVRLNVTTPRGKHSASGLLIDSRGWVATSISAVRDASEIEVILASRSLDSGAAFRTDKTDKASGVIALDEKHDLAIISVNRDLVLNFTDVQFDTGSQIVGSQRLLVGRTPPAGKRMWLRESRVDRRSRFATLNNSTQQKIETAGLNATRDLSWVVHASESGVTNENLGAPLFDEQGKVVAINSGLQGNAMESFAVPIKHLVALKSSATDDPLPLNQLAAGLVEGVATADPQMDETAKTPAMNSEHQEIKDLMASAETCAEFQFVARDEDEIQSLIRLADRLGKANNLAKNITLDYDIREDVKDQIQQIGKLISDSYGQFSRDVQRIRELNETMMQRDLDGKRAVVLIGKVSNNPALDSKFKNKESVRFELSGQDNEIFFPVSSDTPVFRQGEVWLIAGYLNPQPPWRSTGRPDALELEFQGCWKYDPS